MLRRSGYRLCEPLWTSRAGRRDQTRLRPLSKACCDLQAGRFSSRFDRAYRNKSVPCRTCQQNRNRGSFLCVQKALWQQTDIRRVRNSPLFLLGGCPQASFRPQAWPYEHGVSRLWNRIHAASIRLKVCFLKTRGKWFRPLRCQAWTRPPEVPPPVSDNAAWTSRACDAWIWTRRGCPEGHCTAGRT